MTDAQFRRGLFVITALALILPPSIGTVVLVFVGVFPFPDILHVFYSWNGLHIALSAAVAFWLITRYASFVISIASSDIPKRAVWLLKATPWLLFGLLSLYFTGGVLTANASLQAMGFAQFEATDHALSLFAAIPALMIVAMPLIFVLTDHLGRYLAPRGVRSVVAPMWLRLTVLGLFTPVMIDTFLIAYYYDRTSFFEMETFVLWLALILIAGVGATMAWYSFRQSLSPVHAYLSAAGEQEETSFNVGLLVPETLDEIGEMISRWRGLVQRKQAAEIEFRESERRLQNAMSIAKIGYYVWDFDEGQNVYITDEFAALHGMTADEYMTEVTTEESDIALIHPDDREKYIKAMSQRLQTHDPIFVEYRIVGKDGVTRHVRETETAPEWRDDVPTWMEGILQDISDFKAVEQELRQNEERLLNAQRIAKMGDFTWDLTTNVVHRSEGIYRVFGRTRDQLRSNHDAFLEITHPDDRAFVTEAMQAAIRGKPYSFDFRILLPSGEIRYIHEEGELEYDDEGRPIAVSGTAQDITQRRLVENEVRRLNETLESRVERRTRELEKEKRRAEEYLNIAAAIVVAVEGDGELSLINDSGCRLLGYKREELVGKNWFDTCIPEEDRDEVRKVFGMIVDGRINSVANFTNAVLTKDGARRMVSWHNSVIEENGRVLGCLSSGEDVTERLETEEALRRSERETRLISDSLPVGLTYNSKDFIYRNVNPTYAAWFGKTPEEIEGSHVRDVIDPKGLPFIMEQLDKVMAGNLNEFQRTVPTADGPRELSTTQVPYITDTGEVEGFISIIMDVTERLKAERALRRSEREARLVADTLPVGLTYFSNDLTYRRVNPIYASWFGKTPDEMKGVHVRDIIGEQAMSELSDLFDAVLSGETVEYERTVQRKEGPMMLDVTMVPSVRENGEIDGFVTVALDMTERKRAEGHLRHAQKMEALGNLAGGVAHNLNNLLVPIVGLSRMSADDLSPDSAQREVLERIHGASERARDIVARILAFSRQEKPSFERFELKCLVKDALALARTSLPPNIALSVDMSDGDLLVDADRVQIESLFLNIFNNAAAAIGAAEGGRIEISLGQETLGPRRCQLIDPELQEGRYAALVIKDNGSGMDDHTLAHIFDPFFTTKDVGEGTGLGLSMAHGIIREHEGAITVDSKPGRGTLFTIYLPLSDA